MSTTPTNTSSSDVKLTILDMFPALSESFYRDAEIHDLFHVNDDESKAPARQLSNLPQRFNALMEKLDATVKKLKAKIEEIDVNGLGSTATNVVKDQAIKKARQATITNDITLLDQEDRLETLLKRARQAQMQIERSRGNNTDTFKDLGSSFSSSLPEELFNAVLAENGIEIPAKSKARGVA